MAVEIKQLDLHPDQLSLRGLRNNNNANYSKINENFIALKDLSVQTELALDTIDNKVAKTIMKNKVLNSNFDGTTSWLTNLVASFTTNLNEATFTASAMYGQIYQNVTPASKIGDKYYFAAQVKATNNNVRLQIFNQSGGAFFGQVSHTGSGNYEKLSAIAEVTAQVVLNFRVIDYRPSAWSEINAKEIVVINLTELFGAGNEPELSEFEEAIKQYNLNSLYVQDSLLLPVVSGFILGKSVRMENLEDEISETISNKAEKTTLINKVVNGNFNTPDLWAFTLATGATSANEMVFTATAKYGQVYQNLGSSEANHKYYVSASIKADTSQAQLHLFRTDSGNTFGVKNHSGGGAYERISLICTPTINTPMRVRAIDYRDTGWNAISVKDVVVIDLTAIFGVGNEPALEELEKSIKKYNSDNLFVNTTLKTNVIKGEVLGIPVSKKPMPLYVKKTGNKISVNTKYNANQDMRITLDKRGPNSIFDFTTWHLIDNTDHFTSPETVAGTLFQSNSTDWIGPHIVKAVANIDGAFPTGGYFTGGNHGFDNSGTISAGNTATGRTTDIQLFVDGRKVTDFEGYAAYIDIYWSNRVQAANTTKADGTGREVLQENFHYHYNGDKWELDAEIEFLEAVTWETYYGIQSSFSAWNQFLFYHSSANRKRVDPKTSTNGAGKTANLMTLSKAGHYLDMFLDKNVGLGDRVLLTTGEATFTSSGKAYFNLIKTASMLAGDVVTYKGYYRFYNK